MKILKATTGYFRPTDGYLYIFKHGIGPGTIPSDVSIVKTKDLPNYYTAVWLDRFLTAAELKWYDIPSETEINRYLDRIGYCQKDGDVVPCDDVEACGEVKASTDSAANGQVILHDNNAGFETTIKINMWDGAEFAPKKYGADASFDDNSATYAGNIYDDAGNMVGEYVADDSVIIEKNFKINWD